MTDHDHDDQAEHEPTDDDLTELLERWAEEHGGEIDLDRFRSMLEGIMENHPLADTIREMAATGAHFSADLHDWSEQVEISLGYADDAERFPKAHGRSVMIGRVPLSVVRERAQG